MAALPFFTLLALLISAVMGGSAMWQPKLEYIPPHPAIAVEPSGYAVRDELSEAVVQKRYLSFRPNSQQHLWPDKTVSYCFRNSDSRSKLVGYVRDATKLWQMAGLHRDVYKYREVANPGSSCENHNDRASILVITYNAGGGFDATVGVKPLNAQRPNYDGPEMNIGDDDDGRIVSTIAHELGHVWGLYHEHQNKIFWAEPYSHEGGLAFGSNFDCTAIEGYAEAMRKIQNDDPQLAPRLCIDEFVASDYDFRADNWLPDRDLQRNSPWGQSEGKGELYIDLRSIMIYASDGFAAVPGTPVLRTNAGATLFENPVPNHSDVEGIRRIYEDNFNSRHVAPTLPNSTKSLWYSKFADMFRRTKGC